MTSKNPRQGSDPMMAVATEHRATLRWMWRLKFIDLIIQLMTFLDQQIKSETTNLGSTTEKRYAQFAPDHSAKKIFRTTDKQVSASKKPRGLSPLRASACRLNP